ncbi:MAG: FGGY-family carbohydrate kinase, partial [bacterium]
LVKIVGTSTCDCMVHPLDDPLPDVPGMCGIVRGSVLPEFYGLEAGQSAVGDIFNWVSRFTGRSHEDLTKEAEKLAPGQSGLLMLDWLNGNRTILVDPLLTGLVVGLTLATKPSEVYRAAVESTAYGALRIIERMEEYGVKVERVVACGGIADKSGFGDLCQCGGRGLSRHALGSSQDGGTSGGQLSA